MNEGKQALAAARAEGADARTVVQVRLTPAEKKRLARNAEEAGRTVSAYVRERAVHDPGGAPRADPELLRAVWRELRREGSNLNVLLRLAHAYGAEGFDTEAANRALVRIAEAASRAQEALEAAELPGRRNR